MITVATAFYTIVPPLVDFTPTHVFHPEWTGHARLHTVWLLSTNSAIGLLALYALWGRSEDLRSRVRLAGVAAIAVLGGFFVAAFSSPLYHGALTDERGGVAKLPGGLDANAVMFSIWLTIVLIALGLTRGREAGDR